MDQKDSSGRGNPPSGRISGSGLGHPLCTEREVVWDYNIYGLRQWPKASWLIVQDHGKGNIRDKKGLRKRHIFGIMVMVESVRIFVIHINTYQRVPITDTKPPRRQNDLGS